MENKKDRKDSFYTNPDGYRRPNITPLFIVMLLHFIFVIKEEDLQRRKKEYEYVKQMAQFYKIWIKQKFDLDFEVKSDEMITKHRSLFQRLDTHSLVNDHRERGENIFHFYLTFFRPLWTDCTCEGYHAENFGMVWWQEPKNKDDEIFLAEKNCTKVSHELTHELLRQKKYKRYVEDVHDIWMKHYYADLSFERYDKDFKKTDGVPKFLTINTSDLVTH